MELELTGENFEQEVVNSPLPVLIDFWAPWCGPCRMIAPHIKEIADAYEGKIKVGKVNVDDNSDLATKYTVMSIPTVIIFKDGKIMEKKVGGMGKSDLEKLIHPYI